MNCAPSCRYTAAKPAKARVSANTECTRLRKLMAATAPATVSIARTMNSKLTLSCSSFLVIQQIGKSAFQASILASIRAPAEHTNQQPEDCRQAIAKRHPAKSATYLQSQG